jgi:16S rRNA (guanine527-N7)-methyltransferase
MLDFSTKYLSILNTKLKGLNLTNILDPDEFYQKQVLDSINPYLQSDSMRKKIEEIGVIVDVGFGGGFPILPLAKLLPSVKFIGIESKNKKVEAVKLLASELGLNNVKLIHSRLEDVSFDIPTVITFKAVGTIGDYLPSISHGKNKAFVYFYKGPNFHELEMKYIKSLEASWKLNEIQEIEVPGTQKRYLVSFESKNVPRGNFKNLVKLSDFL